MKMVNNFATYFQTIRSSCKHMEQLHIVHVRQNNKENDNQFEGRNLAINNYGL